MTLNGSTVSGNTAAAGGGIYNTSSRSSTVTLTNSTVSGNTAHNSGGGVENLGTLTLAGSTVSDNRADGKGGGIMNDYFFGTLAMSHSTVSGNTAADGGGIYNGIGSILTLTNSTVTNNATGHGGGGGGTYNDGTLTLTDSTVSSNTASFGGGIFNNYASPLTLTNSTVTNNTANNGRGGGIYNQGPMTLIHGTFAGNTAVVAGDMYNRNDFSVTASAANTIVQNCTVEGNSTKALTDNGGNLDGGNGCGFTNASSKSNAKLDLGALADNGGPTLTLLPGAGSDAIGHGVPSVCNDAPVNSRDQRGYTRSTSACTSGAVDPKGTANDSINLNQHGLSGSWADPTANAQGLVMEIGPDFYGAGTGLLFAGWYTYDVTAAGGQRWYTLQAQVSGTTPASAGIYSSTGGRFDSPQATTTTEVGRATLAFRDCTHGTLDYAFTDGSGRSGRIPLTRLLSNTTCSPSGDSGSATVPTLLSGAWADTGNSGQGLVFDMNAADDVVFAGWYTYAPDAAAGSGASGQRWYTLQATFQPGTSTPNGVGVYESTGGTFNAPANTQTTQVGTASLVFNSCASATLKYTFTGGASSGKNGTLELARVGATPSGCHL